ncbi:DUF1758 domain-containing protein [Trichonephila clavipes]|nr:DUF1758 domain-containing protein [Trichonephila clavipes]
MSSELVEAIRNEALPYSAVTRWIGKCQQGRKLTSDEQRSGRPVSVRNDLARSSSNSNRGQTIGKFKKDELRTIADELKLVVPDNAKFLDLRELVQESAEIFYELLRPGQIYCGDSRLLLQNTVFGYIVSGSVGDEVRDNKIHCGLIRHSDLNTTLKSFREFKSIGVENENCNREEDVSLEMFKQRVHFKNDRYEVELPWKRDSDEMGDNFNLEKRWLGSPMRKMRSDNVLYSEYWELSGII